ncbi:MAG TPA: hypothetical protein VGC53_02465 [Vicinamibacteria bacterium]|jgi:hypothetical protein
MVQPQDGRTGVRSSDDPEEDKDRYPGSDGWLIERRDHSEPRALLALQLAGVVWVE